MKTNTLKFKSVLLLASAVTLSVPEIASARSLFKAQTKVTTNAQKKSVKAATRAKTTSAIFAALSKKTPAKKSVREISEQAIYVQAEPAQQQQVIVVAEPAPVAPVIQTPIAEPTSVITPVATPVAAAPTPSCKISADICYGHLAVKFKDSSSSAVKGIELYNENCQKLTMGSSGNFLITTILSVGDRMIRDNHWNLDRAGYINELVELGKLMDAAGIGYRPYEIYGGSDAGTAFEDVARGETGAAVNLRVDPLAAYKDSFLGITSAQDTVRENNEILDSWNLTFVPGKYGNSLGQIGKSRSPAEAKARLEKAFQDGTVQRPSCM